MSRRLFNVLRLSQLPDLPCLPLEERKGLLAHCREKSDAAKRVPEFVYTLGVAGGLIGAAALVQALKANYWWVDHWLTIVLVGGPVVYVVVALYNASQVRRMQPHVGGYLQEVGRCVACGYDLTGTPERCPECGLVQPPRPIPEGPMPFAEGAD